MQSDRRLTQPRTASRMVCSSPFSGVTVVFQIQRFRTSDHYYHHYRHWTAHAPVPKGYVIALHGVQSHSGWYGYSSELIAAAGYDIRFLDRRGSGLNGCERGHTPHFERLINDVRQFLREVRLERDRNSPESPIILMSVSWGGKVAASLAAAHPELIDGLALLYPGLCARVRPTRIQRRLIRFGIDTGKGKMRIPIPLNDPKLFTGEPDWQDYISRDERALRYVSLGFLQASHELESYVARHAEKIVAPLLLTLAGRDEIIDNAATEALALKFRSSHKNFITYRDARHTLEFEPNRLQIFSELVEWLDHLPRCRC
ncbi:MAG TPA: alpha/beta fold hydrolase [Planctomycetaceae bacterium]|nr:alpha/beta fold hydrolase [Planctomycetaceae bacterium]